MDVASLLTLLLLALALAVQPWSVLAAVRGRGRSRQ
jgi:hypothetical protein